jgi:hypothetical protein
VQQSAVGGCFLLRALFTSIRATCRRFSLRKHGPNGARMSHAVAYKPTMLTARRPALKVACWLRLLLRLLCLAFTPGHWASWLWRRTSQVQKWKIPALATLTRSPPYAAMMTTPALLLHALSHRRLYCGRQALIFLTDLPRGLGTATTVTAMTKAMMRHTTSFGLAWTPTAMRACTPRMLSSCLTVQGPCFGNKPALMLASWLLARAHDMRGQLNILRCDVLLRNIACRSAASSSALPPRKPEGCHFLPLYLP